MGRGLSKIAGGAGGGSFQPYGSTDYKTPFPVIDMETGNEIARFNFRMGKYAGIPSISEMNLPVETIPFSKMYQNQPQLDRDQIDRLMKLSVSKISAIRDTTTSSDIPYVIKFNGKYQIQDGHHRLSALWAKGVKSAKVRVLDLGKF